jgi:hypothetical protein
MTPIEQQFEVLGTVEPGATLQKLPDGSYLVTVPLPLPEGWSKTTTQVRFIAPVGYPLSRPDCFWADNDLRLKNGQTPKNTSGNPIPHVGGGYLWFSWHVSSWNPNSDNLLTYLYVIKRRLHNPT